MRKFFLFFSFSLFLYSLDLSQSIRWKALLHYQNNEFKIKDPNFYISKDPSLKKELKATLKAFKKGKYLCKFPARKLFLEKELNITFPKVKCKELEIFTQKVPAKKIYLVFASENIKDPSSMMGHTFFKVEGKRADGYLASHAISFFTLINTLNPLKLIYQNIVPGMEGYFVLRPYKEVVYNYLIKENRNVWEFELNLSDFQKKLILLHSWELKDIKQKYYFTSYNCANVIYEILNVAQPLKSYKFWLTPLELTKITYKSNLIKKTQLLPSDEWLIKMLITQLSLKEELNIKKNVLNQNLEYFKNKNFYTKALGIAYTNYLILKKRKNLSSFKRELESLKLDYVIDLSNYKNPLKTPPERAVGISYKREKDNFIKVSFLPASHFLKGDNREYFNESELKMGYISLIFNQKKIAIDEFSLYNMTNLIPYDIFTSPLSYQFAILLKRDYSPTLKKRLYFKIKGGVGIDFNFLNDINFFILLNAESRVNNKSGYIVYYPSTGVLIYTILNSKFTFSFKPFFKNRLIYTHLNLTQTFFFKNFNIYFNFQKTDSKKELEAGIEKLF